MTSRPPIPIRDRGGSFTLSNPDDQTPIREMLKVGDQLLMITDKCTYRVQMADQIDPDRRNPSLPQNVQQKLFDHGVNSELLCRTLVQAKVMFRKEFQSIDIEKAMRLSFEALSDLISMDDAAKTFRTTEQAAIDKAKRLDRQDASLTIPAVGNVRSACKAFSQKADHFADSLMKLVRLFYPEMKGRHWGDLRDLIKDRYGEGDSFYKLMERAAPLLARVRIARDCLEHKNEKGVATLDFELQADGTVARPTIAIDFRGSSLGRCPISDYMDGVTKDLQTLFELIIVHTCSKTMRPLAGLPMVVGPLSEDQQEAWHVRFGYGAYYDGKFAPCG